MSSTTRHTAAFITALLAGTLALGACGDQVSSDDAAPLPQAEEQSDQVTPGGLSVADVAEDAGKVQQRYGGMSLAQIRELFPTAGTEVPPADLLASTPGTMKRAVAPTRVDGADIGWPADRGVPGEPVGQHRHHPE